MVGSGAYGHGHADAVLRRPVAVLGLGRRLLRALVHEKVTCEEEDSPRVGQVYECPVVLGAREALPVLVHADQVRRVQPDGQGYLLAGKPALDELGDRFHGPKRNSPFRRPQQAVSPVVVTLRYNDVCHNLCDGMLFV